MILGAELRALLEPEGADGAADVLRSYFAPRPSGRFTGAHFERLGGGGDRPEVADHLTAEDVVAVSMLSVTVEADVALELLISRRDRLRTLLRRIPTGVALADLTQDEIGDDWPVRAAYQQLLDIPGIGPTAATKLLARKRPHLVPIVDSVVDAELSLVRQRLWVPLHAWLTADGKANHRHLLALRDRAGLGAEISALRVFDVLVWMTGKDRAR